MSRRPDVTALLYPGPDSLDEADRHEQICALLDDPEQLHRFAERVTAQFDLQRSAEYSWKQAAAGRILTSANEDPLALVASRLAKQLGAGRMLNPPLSRSIVIAFIAGIILGALTIWLVFGGTAAGLLSTAQ
jgi:hypothetical protein